LAKFPEGFLGPIPDFDKGMEKTQDHRDFSAATRNGPPVARLKL
jgi:hypothetical protein